MTNITTASGIAVDDNQDAITAGPRGPVLLQDFHLVEKFQHFDRERMLERVVHAKGSAAYSTFTVTHGTTGYSKAAVFASVGKHTNYDPVGPTLPGSGGEDGAEPGGGAGRYDTPAADGHYTQAGTLFRLLSSDSWRNVIENIASALSQADPAVQDRQIGHFFKAAPSFGHGVAAAIREWQGAPVIAS